MIFSGKATDTHRIERRLPVDDEKIILREVEFPQGDLPFRRSTGWINRQTMNCLRDTAIPVTLKTLSPADSDSHVTLQIPRKLPVGIILRAEKIKPAPDATLKPE